MVCAKCLLSSRAADILEVKELSFADKCPSCGVPVLAEMSGKRNDYTLDVPRKGQTHSPSRSAALLHAAEGAKVKAASAQERWDTKTRHSHHPEYVNS